MRPDVLRMTAPKRIQRRRTRGWRMPPGTIYVGRPTARGNPWRVVGPDEFRRNWWVTGPRTSEECETRADALALAVRKFRFYAEHRAALADPLRGCDIACWCGLCPAHADGKPLGVQCEACDPCHGDIWLELANR